MKDLVRRIVDASNPSRVILFGPWARGEARPDSDIDVLVVMPDGSHRRKTAQAIYRNLLEFATPVDVVVATASDVEKYGDLTAMVYKDAIRDGQELYAA